MPAQDIPPISDKTTITNGEMPEVKTANQTGEMNVEKKENSEKPAKNRILRYAEV